MEFWGVEVKAGQSLKVDMEPGRIIHISQAALGESKKGKGSDLVPLHLKINDQKIVIGSLSSENFPHANFDLVLEKDFELSHGAKNGSIYFCGYSTNNPFLDGKGIQTDSDDSGSDEDVSEDITENGKIEAKPVEVKPAATKGKSVKPESSSKAKISVPEAKKEESDESDDSDDSEEGSSDDDDEDMLDASDDDSDSEDDDDSEDSEDEDEETPKKVESSKKRTKESAEKTPVPTKKAKIVTPQKTDGKKSSAHTATPHPSKKTAGKTPATSNTKDKTPKSEGKITCGSCTKTFNSETALQSHSKAKHSAK